MKKVLPDSAPAALEFSPAEGLTSLARGKHLNFLLYVKQLVCSFAVAMFVVTGTFTAANGQHLPGTLDYSFDSGTGFNDVVETIALQPDGKLVVGGWFTHYSGTPRSRIARLHTDGSLDISFNPGTGFNDRVYSVALQPDGKVIVSGGFSSYNGTAIQNKVRLNTDGSLDDSFDPESVALGEHREGKITLRDSIDSNGMLHKKIERLYADGSVDRSFNPDDSAVARLYRIAVQPDGKVIVARRYDSQLTAGTELFRLNTDGSLDGSFKLTYFDKFIAAIVLQPDGKLLVGGSDDVGITRLNTDGTLDRTFKIGTGFNNNVNALVLQPDGKLVVGGWFTAYNGTRINRIARLNLGEILSAGKELKAQKEVLVYPNPGKGDVNLIMPGITASGSVNLVLHNAMGCKVFAYTVTAGEAQSGLKLSTTGLASGVYYLNISSGGRSMTKRLVLTN